MLVAFAMVLGAFSVEAHAEQQYSEKYYRVYDFTKHLSQEEMVELDQKCIDIMNAYYMDVTAVGIASDRQESDTLDGYAEYEYSASEFGYGENRDGIIFVWNTETDEMDLLAKGTASEYVTAEKEEEILQVLRGMDHSKYYDVFHRYTELAEAAYSSGPAQNTNTTETAAAVSTASDAAGADANSENTNASDADEPSKNTNTSSEKPWWYPTNTSSFVPFNDENADRLVDAADIFDEQEEEKLRTLLKDVRQRYNKDLVIYTDSKSYGMSHSILAADFYDYCGYGVGENHEGFVLLICMDPDNRGYYITGTGPESMSLHTYSNSQRLDDGIYNYLRAGQYAAAAEQWIQGIDDMYRTGIAFPPAWYPEAGQAAEKPGNMEKSRVYDEAGFMSDEEKAALEERIASLQKEYDADFVVLTTDDLCGMEMEEYLEKFYTSQGYGFRDTADGYALLLRTKYNYSEAMTFGNAKAMSDKNDSRMETRIGIEDTTYQAATLWLDMQENYLKKGRVPHGKIYWSFRAVFGLLIGLIFGWVSLGIAKNNMAAEKADPSAEQYITASRFTKVRSRFLSKVVHTRVIKRDPPKSSGGSGGMSYSGSYSGSSGTSHSGSGRSF